MNKIVLTKVNVYLKNKFRIINAIKIKDKFYSIVNSSIDKDDISDINKKFKNIENIQNEYNKVIISTDKISMEHDNGYMYFKLYHLDNAKEIISTKVMELLHPDIFNISKRKINIQNIIDNYYNDNDNNIYLFYNGNYFFCCNYSYLNELDIFDKNEFLISKKEMLINQIKNKKVNF